jgi:hypothetical protein
MFRKCYTLIHNHLFYILLFKVYRLKEKNHNSVSRGCQTWCLTVKEAQRIRIFENRILRRIFIPRTKVLKKFWK